MELEITRLGRWVVECRDLSLGQLLSARYPVLPSRGAGRPADTLQRIDQGAAPDAEGSADRGLGYADLQARHGPLLRQGTLELRERAEDVEQQFALRRRRVHRLGQRAERDAAPFEVVHHGQQVRQQPPEAVEFPDHETVAGTQEGVST